MANPSASFERQITAVVSVWLVFNLTVVALVETDDRLTDPRRLRLAKTARLFEEHACSRGATGSDVPHWRYRLHVPRGRSSERLPVVLYLHGSGERGDDNIVQLGGLPEYLARRVTQRRFPCLVVVPQCPAETFWTSSIRQRRSQSGDDLPMVMRILDEVLARADADPSRVYLIGYSMGAYGAWELAIQYPQRFAAVVSVAGGGDPVRVGALKGVPVWAVHGADDKGVPPKESREMIAALRAAGGSPMYSELKGVGHAAVGPGLIESSEVLVWMFDHRRPDGD
ncbi:MAG: alpha/beta fold hydrolase [Planctomycetaceae bacterium]